MIKFYFHIFDIENIFIVETKEVYKLKISFRYKILVKSLDKSHYGKIKELVNLLDKSIKDEEKIGESCIGLTSTRFFIGNVEQF